MDAALPRPPSLGNRQITTTNVRDPYKIIGFGGGGGKNPYDFTKIFTTTTAKPYHFIGIADIGGGILSVPDPWARKRTRTHAWSWPSSRARPWSSVHQATA